MTMCHSTSAFHRALTEWHRARMRQFRGLQALPKRVVQMR
jgi:hypothetical protein